MQTLTIGAESLETALGYLDCLRGFRTTLVETGDGRQQVKVTMDGPMDIYVVLDAIDRHVAGHATGGKRLDRSEALLSEPVGGD